MSHNLLGGHIRPTLQSEEKKLEDQKKPGIPYPPSFSSF